MLSRNPLSWLLRIGWIFVLGIGGAIATGNPLYLLLCVLGVAVLVYLLVREGVRPMPKWVTAMNEGLAQGQKGEWTEAITTFKTAMASCRTDSARRQASERIGLFLLRANRPGEAEPYLREAVTLTTRAFGPMAVRTLTLRNQLSDLYVKAGQAWQAAQLQGFAISGSAAKEPTAAAGAADTAARYAEALQLSGDSAQASVYNQKALESLAKADRKSALFVRAVISAARAATAVGDQNRAIELLKQALEDTNYDTPATLIDEARATLVDLYAATHRYGEAIAIMQDRLKKRSGRDPGRTADMHRRLADLMDADGRPNDAIKERRVAQTLDGMLTAAGHKTPPPSIEPAGLQPDNDQAEQAPAT